MVIHRDMDVFKLITEMNNTQLSRVKKWFEKPRNVSNVTQTPVSLKSETFFGVLRLIRKTGAWNGRLKDKRKVKDKYSLGKMYV